MADLDRITLTWDEHDRPVIEVTYASDGAGSIETDPTEWLTAFGQNLTDNSARNLRNLVDLNEQRGFVSLTDLAAELEIDKKEADSWNRNLGRSIKKMVREQGFLRLDADDGTAQLFDYKWDNPNNQWTYEVPSRFRAALVEAIDGR
jgi:hypothetical protein